MSFEEFSYLLWATQGVREIYRDGTAVRRTVPSAGSCHPFETYLLVNAVEGLEVGLYRYLGRTHEICLVDSDPALAQVIHASSLEQYVLQSAVVFIWTAVPYRTEYRYGPLAHKMIAQDSGHLCQNLYLACESIGVGTCALGAFSQDRMDAALNLDGEDEFTIYMAPVGRY